MILLAAPLVALPLVSALAPEPDGSRFGRAVLTLDDLDGDGVREIAVGAPTALNQRGLVLVLSGKTQDVLATWRGPEARSTFGHTLRSILDVDGDGIDDVLVGYEFWARTELRSGKDGTLVHAIDRDWEEVIPFGDFDGDGAGDLLVTTVHFWEVRSGRTNGLLNGKSWVRSGGRFDAIGDVDGDGLVDGIYFSETAVPMLSARPEDNEPAHTRLFAERNRSTVAELWPEVFEGETQTVVRAAPAGDLDGDGRNDFLVGTASKKASSIIALSFEDRSKALTRIEGVGRGIFGDETLGYATLSGIDIDGNGRCDVVLGNTITVFEVHVLAAPGSTEEPTRQAKWPEFEGSLWRSDWSDGGATSGVAIAAFQDADGDGAGDVLVGSSDWHWHGTVLRNGTLRLLSGRTGEEIWTVTEHRYEELAGPAKEAKSPK